MSAASGRLLPQEACAAALAALPGIGPATLRRLLDDADPSSAWDAVRSGEVVRPPATGRSGPSWRDAASGRDVEQQWAECAVRGISVTWWGDDGYPARLIDDPEAPGVLFWTGAADLLSGRCVAIVGTRRCTSDGRSTAYHLGRELAAAGICVVSGLALGVDGAAHQGALDGAGPGGTAGVAASGVDVAYPPRHAALWERVAARGVIVSETPPGRPAQAWRFPSRNRVIAGLADMVVVIESHAAGGSMLTVEAALARGVAVGAVPGPVASPSSAGTNQLLVDGATPIRDATDVLDALGILLDRPGPTARRRPAPACAPDPVLDAVGWRPTSLARIVTRSGRPLGAVAASLEDARAAGTVREEGGWWTRVPPGT